LPHSQTTIPDCERLLGGFDLHERGPLTTINSACIAFSHDGLRLAVGEHHGEPDFRVLVFDTATKALVTSYVLPGRRTETKRTGVSAIAFSPDGRWLAAGLRDGRLLVWDTKESRPMPIVPRQHGARIVKIAFVPGGDTLVAGSIDGRVSLCDVGEAWKTVASTKLDVELNDFAVSPDGLSLACQLGWKCKILEMASLRRTAPGVCVAFMHEDVRHPLVYSPDGGYLLASSQLRQERLQLLDSRGIKKDRLLVDNDLGRSHIQEIHHAEFSPDGTLVVSGSADNTVKIWDLASGRLVLTLPAVTEAVCFPSFSPDGRTLAVGTSQGTTLYDVRGQDVLTTRGMLPELVAAFSFQARGTGEAPDLAIVSKIRFPSPPPGQHLLSFQDVESGKIKQIVDVNESRRGSRPEVGIAAHPFRDIVAVNLLNRVQLFEHGVERIRIDTDKNPSSLVFSRDGERLWGVIDELGVVSWSTADWSRKTAWLDARREQEPGRVGITSLAVGSTWVVAGSRAGRIDVIRARDSQPERRHKTGGSIQSVALCPDESLVACGLAGGKLALLRLDSSDDVRDFVVHQDSVESVDFSSDGRMLVTGSKDRTLALWTVDGLSAHELVRIPSPSGRPILSARFSPDGRTLGVLIQNEHAVRIWHLDMLRQRLGAIGVGWDENGRLDGRQTAQSD
jgi:WD40 repeat protein